jgi:hypothetical protein
MKRIVVLFPYFGSLPPQYGMWRASALYNSDIDFMFFTDCDVQEASNILVHKMQFSDFKQKIQNAFDFPIVLDRPYKICEYRPAFAYALSEYIKDYDFWGWGDLDVVYGDIHHFVTDDVLSRYKMISGLGHFSLYHNDEDTNTYFMKEIPGYQNYKEAFTTSASTFFDEIYHKGFGDKWRECRPNDCWLDWQFDNVSRPKEAYHFNSLNRGWTQVIFEHIDNKLFMIRFNNRKLEKKESLYAHFQHRGFMKDKVTDYNHFLVTPNTIIDFPKSFVNLRLRFLCRKRTLMTLYHQFHDYIIWRLHLTHYK